MPRITILNDDEKNAYDNPPVLTVEEKPVCFFLTEVLEKKIKSLHTSTNKVCFLLQHGYFTISKRFFLVDGFRDNDIAYVANLLDVPLGEIDLSKYKSNMSNLHKESILALQGFKSLEDKELDWFTEEIKRQIKRFTKPRKIFFEVLQLLYDRNVELPSYHTLSDLISAQYNTYESKLLGIIKMDLPTDLRKPLDGMLLSDIARSPGILNKLKYINQSKKPKAIKASIGIFNEVSDLFLPLKAIIQRLNLTPQSTEYYATWVKKSKISQLKQFPDNNKTYLHLVAFIQHQYYLRQDAFVDIFLRSVQTAKNTVKIRLKQNDYLTRNERKAAVLCEL